MAILVYEFPLTYDEANRVLDACRIAIDEYQRKAEVYEKKGMLTSAAVERVYIEELETIMKKIQAAVVDRGW